MVTENRPTFQRRQTESLTDAAISHIGLLLVLILDATVDACSFNTGMSSKFLELLHGVRAALSASLRLQKNNSLEFVCFSLPFTPDLDSHLDTTVHLFCSALVIDAELKNVAILPASAWVARRPLCSHLEAERARQCIRISEPDVVQE